MWVDASYDLSDDQLLTGATDEWQKIKTANGALRHNNRVSTKLAGLPAIEDAFEDSTPKGESFEESIVALRSGIVYTVGLHTTKAYKTVDEKQLRRIRYGFRLFKLPNGACTNG